MIFAAVLLAALLICSYWLLAEWLGGSLAGGDGRWAWCPDCHHICRQEPTPWRGVFVCSHH